MGEHMAERPCPGFCNSRARKAWRDYESAVAAWQAEAEAYADAVAAGEDPGERPEPPAEPDVKVWHGDPIFCKRCASQVRSALANLDQLAGLLQADIDGMRGLPSMEREGASKRGRGASAPSPDPRVEDVDELYRHLTAIEDWWRGVHPEYGPRPYMGAAGEQPLHAGSHPRSRAIGWLGDHLADMLQHPDCGPRGLRLLVWERKLQDATKSRPEPRHLAARCPGRGCGQRTLFRRADGNIECRSPECHAVLYEDEYGRIRDAELKERTKRPDASSPELQEAS